MLRVWRWLNGLAWWWRWPLKSAVFAIGLALVAYPYVWLIPTWLGRLADLNAVVEPEHPAIIEFTRQIAGELPADVTPEQRLAVVQAAVERRVPYAWDWDVWGVADYVPTVGEVFEKGREDCDGRAVIAASVLRRMGCEAWLVNDLLHVWVETPEGETMSPGRGEKTLVGPKSGERGTSTRFSLALFANLARSLSFGVAVFPLAREVVLVVLFLALCVRPRAPVRRAVVGSALACGALMSWRVFGEDYARGGADWSGWGVLLGVGLLAASWVLLTTGRRLRAADGPCHSASARPESPAVGDASPD